MKEQLKGREGLLARLEELSKLLSGVENKLSEIVGTEVPPASEERGPADGMLMVLHAQVDTLIEQAHHLARQVDRVATVL